MYLGSKAILTILDLTVTKGVIAKIKEKNMTNVEKILQAISTIEEPITLKKLQDATELKPGILSGTLCLLCKQGKLTREKVEFEGRIGPKLMYVYKVVANPQQ